MSAELRLTREDGTDSGTVAAVRDVAAGAVWAVVSIPHLTGYRVTHLPTTAKVAATRTRAQARRLMRALAAWKPEYRRGDCTLPTRAAATSEDWDVFLVCQWFQGADPTDLLAHAARLR